MTVTRESLKAEIAVAQTALSFAQTAYDKFDQAAENNVFESLEAAGALEETLSDRAFQDCEGAGNCGAEIYEQEFMVGDVTYVATLACEYNRHDKTYYYVDGSERTNQYLRLRAPHGLDQKSIREPARLSGDN